MSGYLVGLLGAAILRSLTPAMHEREARALGLEYEYRVLDLFEMNEHPDATASILHRAFAEGYDALNITHPCKQLVVPHLDELSDTAASIGAVNLVLFRGGRYVGHNTDVSGFGSALVDGLADAPRARVLQIGAGGAGSATAWALLESGVAELVLTDKDPSRASRLAATYRPRFPGQRIEAVELDQVPHHLATVDGVVQATPMGMKEHPGVPFDVSHLKRDAWVADIVYVPLETELLRSASAAGHRTLDGGRMAVGQAYDSLRLITGLEPDRARMRAHLLELAERESGQVGGGALTPAHLRQRRSPWASDTPSPLHP